jgi:hypothetical protein
VERGQKQSMTPDIEWGQNFFGVTASRRGWLLFFDSPISVVWP